MRLPWPAHSLSLAALGERVRILDESGLAHGVDRLPLMRALVDCVPATAEIVCEFLDDGSRRHFTMASLPFFDPPGQFAGVGNYLKASP